MKTVKYNSRGFTHTIALVAVVGTVGVGAVGITVAKHSHDAGAKDNIVSTSGSLKSKKKIDASQTSATGLTVASTTHESPTSTPSTQVAKPASKSSTSTAPKSGAPSSASGSPAPSASPAPAPAPSTSSTPMSVLTSLIADLDKGAQVNVTSASVTVAGPISDAHARPIVFTANGQKYYAYRQGSAPDFSTTPAQTANTMAIISASGNSPVVSAHLDKAGNLVDPDISGYMVGYSMGGN
jgi:hypothetical protein